MSTKITLWSNEEIHLYQEGFDNAVVYLEITSPPLEALILKIPLPAWKEMRKHTIQPDEHYLDMAAEEFLNEVERKVDEHRAGLTSAPASSFEGLFGVFIFGSSESSREDMIEHFVATYRPDLSSQDNE